MMEKNGQIQIKFIALAIAVFILAFAAIFLFRGGEISKFFDFLPSFGEQKPVEGIQVLRYDIVNDKVEYYDGIKGTVFEGKTATLGDKEISYQDAYNAFTNRYYDKSARSDSLVYLSDKNYFLSFDMPFCKGSKSAKYSRTGGGAFSGCIDNSEALPEGASPVAALYFIYWAAKDLFAVRGGAVVINVNSKGNTYGRGTFVLSIIDADTIWEAYSEGNLINKLPYLRFEIKNKAKEWRDGVLKTPIGITTINSISSPIYVCLKKADLQDKSYLVADLTKSVSSSTTC